MYDDRTYRELESGVWALANPAKCPCHNGWLHSDYDSYHRCPLHGSGVPHPDDLDTGDTGFDMPAHNLRVLRETYASYRDQACRMGFKGNFRLECMLVLEGGFEPSPQDWVNAAEMVVDQLHL